MATEDPLRRYAAHLALDAVGPVGQQRIRASRVMLIGLGGLGCPVATYLAGSGVGDLHLCDFDTVSETNLARQLLYAPSDTGRRKCEAAAEALGRLNSGIRLHTHDLRADRDFLKSILPDCDLLIDASDNYGTRLAINDACLEYVTPWVMGACIRMEGQIMRFDPRNDNEPCYRCAYGSAPETLEDCPGAGIFSPVAGMTGTAMAHLALLHLAGGRPPGGLHLLDASGMNWKSLEVARNPGCPACAETLP